ncbi:Hypothetical predicted protein [Cloeon dipterum]|uniref:Mitotic-spindle organizing protein 1 n=1 Tax=Cloeon dipterum TaxID=197152 RepID=A0A8S1C5X1_9INSE|nr:Hypothetical predicted protein [Cloeon dipterum]
MSSNFTHFCFDLPIFDRFGPCPLPVGKMSRSNDNSHKSIADIREAFRVIREIADILHTGMEPEVLATCVKLIEQGANPDVLARVVVEMSAESKNLSNSSPTSKIEKSKGTAAL